MTRVYIIHGYSASIDDHWFPWLENKLTQDGLETHRIALPNSHQPKIDEWLETLQHAAPLDNDTYIIAHSLGCITAIRYIAQMNTQIRGAIFVSGFDQRVPGLPMLDNFVASIPNMFDVGKLIAQKQTILSQDDSIVPKELTMRFASDLQSPLLEVENAGHFLASDGFTELPYVYDRIRYMISH